MDENQNQGQPQRRAGIGSILISLTLVIGVVLLFYFMFIRPSTQPKIVVYNNADIVYNYSTDEPSKEENKLAYILWNENVTELRSQANTSAQYYAIEGTYIEDPTTKAETTFRATIDGEGWECFSYIITNRVVNTVDGNGNVVSTTKYYSGDAIYQAVAPSNGNSWTSWLPTIIMIAGAVILSLFLMRKLTSSIKDANKSQTDFNSSRARKEMDTKVKFSDVAGCEEVKTELIEVVDYFRNAEKYTKLGAKLPKGVLLVGPPGTGKTLLAKAVAGEADVAFYSISGSDFVEMFVGVGAGRVRDMFKTAKANAPCLIFIDEIDAVGRQRGAGLGGGNDEREQTLNQLLVEMDGFNDNSGVIVMAATNRSDILDPALTRAGRFDRQITVDLPDKAGREAILKVHSRNKKVDPSINYANIASRTVGMSGADLANVMNEAAILAVRERRDVILSKDIDEAIDRCIAGPAKTSTSISPEEKRQIAYHEAGHAIIGLVLPYSDVVQKITIVPRGNAGGYVNITPDKDRFNYTKNQLLARITCFLGGRSSEEIFFGDVSTGASQDIAMATRLARAMVTEYGMSELGPVQYDSSQGSVFLGRDYTNSQRNFSSQVAYEIDKEIRAIIDSCHEKARQVITEHKDDIVLLAETLITKETITSEEITYLMEHRELPPEPEVPVVVEEVASNPSDSNNPYSLPSEFDEFIKQYHDMCTKSPRKMVIIASVPGSGPLTYPQLKKVVHKFAPEEKFVGTVLLTKELYTKLTISLEEFAGWLESTDSAELFLIKTDDDSVYALKETIYPTKALQEKLQNAKKQDDNVIDAPSTPTESEPKVEEEKVETESKPEEKPEDKEDK